MKNTETPHIGATDAACPSAANDRVIDFETVEVVDLKSVPSVNMSLLRVAASAEADAFITTFATQLCQAAGPKTRSTKAYRTALAAIIADLLKSASYDPIRPCYRPMACGDFTGRRIAYKAFKRPIRHLLDSGFITIEKGWCEPGRVFAKEGQVTRIWATASLINLLSESGLCADDWRQHFTLPTKPTDCDFPIRLKVTRPKRKPNGDHPKAQYMAFDKTDPRVVVLANLMNEFNRLMAPHVLGGAEHDAFYRTFNCGDDPDFAWNMSGRIYSAGGYQNVSKADRKKLTINGEPAVEVDIRASHLTILHALEGVPLPSGDNDPFDLDPAIHRKVIKAWVAMTLGHTGYHHMWSPDIKERLGADLQKRHPVRTIEALVRAKIPLLDKWETSSIRWQKLQHIESEIILRAALGLVKNFNCPCYPLHDSLIAPASKVGIVKLRLKSSFHHYLGIYPYLSVE
ncbi:hypothetical protein ACFSC3_02945 [Sphingomonas floccifaciens]|jgi:hypothetical protein|uniref:Uncharacterized protein n=1 Tax=Sphingomonas floccifaciens TaxID=1844115 RepID=A0ABW4N8P6_9SPHN